MRCDLDCSRGIFSRTLFADIDFFCALPRGDLVEYRHLRDRDCCCLKAENLKIPPKEFRLFALWVNKDLKVAHKHIILKLCV